MIIGPAIIKECPHCLQPFKQWTMKSGSSFGAINWSDGKVEAPFLLETPPLVKCPTCEKIIWLSKARLIAQERRLAEEQWRGVQKYRPPLESDYLTFLETESGLDDEKILYIRIRAWWAANDPLRRMSSRHPQKNKGHSPNAQANMRALLTLLDHTDEKQRMLKAELERELGNFESAAELISTRFSKENLSQVKYLKKLIEERNSRVSPFPPNPYDRSAY